MPWLTPLVARVDRAGRRKPSQTQPEPFDQVQRQTRHATVPYHCTCIHIITCCFAQCNIGRLRTTTWPGADKGFGVPQRTPASASQLCVVLHQIIVGIIHTACACIGTFQHCHLVCLFVDPARYLFCHDARAGVFPNVAVSDQACRTWPHLRPCANMLCISKQCCICILIGQLLAS